ncbi:MAG: hypothetical protein JSW27_09810 [Phycisphaerales bacterium]|nr:MAG: hypothetical protein JSW27_09810 [Phycisphaerales bacterium]
MEKKTTYGLRLEQMASLFAMGADAPDIATPKDDDETLRALLREQLMCVEPKGSLLRDTLAMMMDRAAGRPGLSRERPLGEILLQPHSDMNLLEAIKDASKTLSVTLDSQTETALARTVYFAAIAAALVHHDVKITQNSYDVLAESVATLKDKPWMAAELAELFAQAQEICRRRSNET